MSKNVAAYSASTAIALGALLAAFPVRAQVEKTVSSGIWSAFAGTSNGTPTCGVGAQLPDRSFAVSVQRDHHGVVRITVGTPGWDGEQVPPHTDVSFEPNGELYGLTSAGRTGHFDYFDLDSAKVRGWVHDFTAGSKMILSFPDEAAWSFDLTGTSPAISAMLKCVTDYNLVGLPAPFALAGQPEMPSPATALAPIAPPAPAAPTVKGATGADATAAQAETITLLCHYRYVTCIALENMCGEEGDILVTVDTVKKLMDGRPAKITDDYFYQQLGDPKSYTEISRKTGVYEHRSEETRTSNNIYAKYCCGTYYEVLESKGSCSIAPANKF